MPELDPDDPDQERRARAMISQRRDLMEALEPAERAFLEEFDVKLLCEARLSGGVTLWPAGEYFILGDLINARIAAKQQRLNG